MCSIAKCCTMIFIFALVFVALALSSMHYNLGNMQIDKTQAN